MKKIFVVIICCICSEMAAAQTSYTLEQILNIARMHNITLRNAYHAYDAAIEQRKEAFTKYFPSISGTGLWFNANKGMAQTTVTPSEMISPEMGAGLAQMFPAEALAALANPVSISMMKNGTIGSLMAVQPVFAGGQIVNANRLAKVGEDVANLQLQLSENEVEKTAEQYFWQIVTLQEKMKTVAAVEAMLADIHKDVDVAVRAGVALRNDLLQVDLRQNEVESQKLKLQNGINIVKLLLAQYCGLSSSDFTILSSELLSSDSINAQPNYAQYTLNYELNTLPEYQLLQKQVEAAALQKKMAVGQNLPSIAVGAGFNYHNLLDKNRAFGMVFATVSIPISNWWGGSHAIKRKKIEYQRALDEQQDKAQLLEIRIQNAWNNVVEARQQLGIAQRSIEQADENLRLHRDYYRAGTCKMSDLLEAQLLYQQSLDRRTDAYAQYQIRQLEYRQATGTAATE